MHRIAAADGDMDRNAAAGKIVAAARIGAAERRAAGVARTSGATTPVAEGAATTAVRPSSAPSVRSLSARIEGRVTSDGPTTPTGVAAPNAPKLATWRGPFSRIEAVAMVRVEATIGATTGAGPGFLGPATDPAWSSSVARRIVA